MDNKQKGLLAGGILGGLLLGANAGKILRGIGIGLLAIVASFAMIFFSVNGVKENSIVVADLQLQDAREVQDKRGEVKVFGTVATDAPLSIELFECEQTICVFPKELLNEQNLIYKKVVLQRFEVVRDVQEEEQSGSTSTEKVSYKNQWVTKDQTEEWADVKLEGLKLDPESAIVRINKESDEIEGVLIEGMTNLETYGRSPEEDEPAFGTTRALVTFIPQDDREYIVIGELRNQQITSGTTYVVSDQSDAELVDTLAGEESSTRWGVRIFAFLVLTFGFTSMLSPILVFTDMIPLAGGVARGLATMVSAVLAGIIVLLTVFLLNFWWVIGILVVAGVLGFVYMGVVRNNKAEQAA